MSVQPRCPNCGGHEWTYNGSFDNLLCTDCGRNQYKPEKPSKIEVAGVVFAIFAAVVSLIAVYMGWKP